MSDASHFRLQASVLRDEFRHRLEDHLFADIIVRTNDGYDVPAHRLVLAAASATVKEALQEIGDEPSVILMLPDFSNENLKTILPYLYGGCNAQGAGPEPDPELLKCLQIGNWNKIQTVNIKVEASHESFFLGNDDYEDDEYMDYEPDNDMGDMKSKRSSSDHLVDEVWECINCGDEMTKQHFFQIHLQQCVGDSLTDLKNLGEFDENEKKTRKPRRQKYYEVAGGWKCEDCDVFVPHKHLFKNHNEVCFAGGNADGVKSTGFKCGECQRDFKDIPTLKEHLIQSQACSISEASTPTLICDVCPRARIMYSQKKFEVHLMKHQAKFECKLCDKTFNEYDKMSKHVKLQHGQQLKREFTCKLCSKSFEYEKNLANHLKVHDKPRRTEFKCDQCDRVFNNKSTLCYHRQRHATPFLQCTICAKEVKTPKGLRYHMSLHTGVTDFLCHDCGKGFVTRQKLMNHRRSKHTFEKPFICDQCGQGFHRSDKLVVHRRRAHTGEKPYQCEHCEWRGVDSSSLIHHRKKHLNEAARRSVKDHPAAGRSTDGIPEHMAAMMEQDY